MNRKELQLQLQVAGLWNPPIRKEHPLWITALQEYKKQTGDQEVNLACGSCVKKIKAWMERD